MDSLEDLRHSELRQKVLAAYSEAALAPENSHAFPIGRQFAQSLGYPEQVLASLPTACVEVFTGVSDVSVFAEIPEGATVLDLGCGAGLDSIIAARRTGSAGRVLGIDFSYAMLTRASQSAAEAGLSNTLHCQAAAESLPVRDKSVDVALVNGIFNLNPNRGAIFHELDRVMSEHGVVYSAELVLREPLPPEQRYVSNWFA